MTKKFRQIDGTVIDVRDDQCRGCWMNENAGLIPALARPIFENDNVIVRQDIEWPVPGFYIVSVRDHIGSIADLSPDIASDFFLCLYHVRKGLNDLFNIKRVQIYHEEKLKTPHVHFWMLPLWEDILDKYDINPRIYESNIPQYLSFFDYNETKKKIAVLNQVLSIYLSEQENLITRGFFSRYQKEN